MAKYSIQIAKKNSPKLQPPNPIKFDNFLSTEIGKKLYPSSKTSSAINTKNIITTNSFNVSST